MTNVLTESKDEFYKGNKDDWKSKKEDAFFERSTHAFSGKQDVSDF